MVTEITVGSNFKHWYDYMSETMVIYISILSDDQWVLVNYRITCWEAYIVIQDRKQIDWLNIAAMNNRLISSEKEKKRNNHNHFHHSSARAWIVRYPQTSFTEKSCFLFVSMKRPIIAKYHSKGNKTLVSRRKLTCLEQANLSNLNRYISKVPSYVPLLSKNRPLPEVQTTNM